MEHKHYDFIVVGQGIGGTMLVHHILKSGKTVCVIDNDHKGSASMVAAGLINPITGRKYVKSWRIEDFLPYAIKTYEELGERYGIKAFTKRKIYRALYGPKEENIFYARSEDPIASQYIDLTAQDEDLYPLFKGVSDFGAVSGGQGHLKNIITAVKTDLIHNGNYKAEKLDYSDIHFKQDKVYYHDISADYIICAEGHKAIDNPYFKDILHEPAKGEVLLIRIPGAPIEEIIRHKLFIIPMYEDIYWIGAGYIWDFDDDKPTDEERARLISQLDDILNIPYEIVDHQAAIRPCLKGRRPKIGRHPDHRQMFLFTGMGTKGTSLAPYWSNHLIEHILHGTEIDQEVRL